MAYVRASGPRRMAADGHWLYISSESLVCLFKGGLFKPTEQALVLMAHQWWCSGDGTVVTRCFHEAPARAEPLSDRSVFHLDVSLPPNHPHTSIWRHTRLEC